MANDLLEKIIYRQKLDDCLRIFLIFESFDDICIIIFHLSFSTRFKLLRKLGKQANFPIH